ncbi:MAG: HEAT repeat domain-containing protein [Candidatus Heimdallarchaeota archaeon]
MSESSVVTDLRNLKAKNHEVRLSAVINLRRFLESSPEEFRERMVRKSLQTLTKDGNDQVREAAIITLIGTARETPKLVAPLVFSILSDPQDPNPGIRSYALEWLSEKGHSKLPDFTIKALKDPNKAVLNTALNIVVKHQIKGVEPILLRLLETETGGLRRTVIYALGKLKTPRAIGALIEIMRNPEFDDLTRNQASSALEHMEEKLSPEVTISFIENLTDSNEYVRETAAAFLKKSESEIIKTVIEQGKLDLLALLHLGTRNTKQNFDSAVSALQNQMSFAIEDFRSRVSNKSQFHYSELANEFQLTELTIKILIEDMLKLQLYPLSDGTIFTENGLKKLIKAEFEQFDVIQLPILLQRSPFDQIGKDILETVVSEISGTNRLSPEIYITEALLSEISDDIQNKGYFSLLDLSKRTNVSPERIREVILPKIYDPTDGWLNSEEVFLTRRFVREKWRMNLAQYKIQGFNKFIQELGNPQIEFREFVDFINGVHPGRWLEGLQVFIDLSELAKIEHDINNLGETEVQHLLPVIGIDFSDFLDSLVKSIKLQVFRVDSGKVTSIKNVLDLVKDHYDKHGYLHLEQFIQESGFSRLSTEIKRQISEFLLQEYVSRQDKDGRYYIEESLLTRVQNEISTHPRINFDVLAFKLELPDSILRIIVHEVLQLSGITNSVGEFITERGILQEINGILEYRQELALAELGEILDLDLGQSQLDLFHKLIDKNEKLVRTSDERILTLKNAAGRVLYFINRPEQQAKKIIRWGDFSTLNIPPDLIRRMVTSMVQNNMLPGSLNKSGYHPK